MRAAVRAPLGAVVFLVLGASFAPARGAAAERTVLAEFFGNPSCAECRAAREELIALQLEHETFLWLDYHTVSPLSSADTRERHEYYGTPDVPALLLDGELISGGARAAVEKRLEAGAPLLVVADYLFDSDPWIGNIDIAVPDGESIERPEECSVRFVIFEERVPCCAEEAEDWPVVVRAVQPAEPLTASIGGQTQTIAYTIPGNPAWNVDLLRAAAFVQRDSDHSILNAALGLDAGSLNPIPGDDPPATAIQLAQNVPNPARGNTEIVFHITKEGWVTLRLFNISGEVVRVLNDGVRTAGRHSIVWNGTDGRGRALASGVYAYELLTVEGSRSRRLTLIR